MSSKFIFIVTCLLYLLIVSMGSRKPPTGHELSDGRFLDALGVGFAISSFILTIIVLCKGGFDWVSQHIVIRILFAVVGCLSMAAVIYVCVVFKWDWEWYSPSFPQFLRYLSLSNGQVWIPLLTLVPYLFLLSTNLKESVSPLVYKVPLVIAFGLTTFIALNVWIGWVRFSVKH